MTIEDQKIPLKVFGNHNLLNAQAAWLVCQQLNVSAAQFGRAISTFTGAAKRLELLAENNSTIVYRDFAHAPSKVKATIEAVRAQFPDKKLFAVLELHTYSSLNEAFMQEYKGVMQPADAAVVFYAKHALELKRMPELKKEAVQQGFASQNMSVLNTKTELEEWLNKQDYHNSVLLFMSSGNYDGLDISAFAQRITATRN